MPHLPIERAQAKFPEERSPPDGTAAGRWHDNEPLSEPRPFFPKCLPIM